jgi:hypothetical protein
VRIEKYVAEIHYPIVYHWWRAQTGRTLDPAQISDDGCLVVAEDGRPICASWLYWGNSRLAHIGFTVANPKARPKEKIYSLNLAIQYLITRAKEVGMRIIVSNSDRPALTKLFQKAGFQTMEQHTSLSLHVESLNYGDQEIY